LYEDLILGNCQPPSCPKPTNLLVTSVSQTSVTASWTETGSAPQWEVYAVVEGGTPPVNGSPLNTGVAGYSIATTNVDFPITNLLPGTKYQYYVRAICSATDISNWTLLTPKSFITRPANDECSAAINVPVNPTQVCSQIVSGNTLGGTASIEVSTCPGIENDDVWFSFVATNNIHIVNLQNIVGSTTSLRFAVYEGGDCSTFNQIFCSATGNNNAVLLNLTAGTIYKIRVYTNGSIVTQSASFDICVSTPPAPATNDECVDAIDVVVNTLSECAYVTPGNLIGATGSTGVSNTCVGTEDDDVWFKFVATSGNHIISLLNVEGTTTNLNHAVYSGTCSNLVQLYCSAAGSLNSNNLNYVIGNTYYLRVWSNGSNSEVVTFNVCIKPVSSCQNAAPFCGGSVDNPYIFPNTTNLPNSTQVACLFSIPNPTYYTLHVGQTGPINFTMYQNTNISTTGQLLGNNLDVDFVAWGPFTSTDACDEIVFGPCPGGCGNNTSNPNFYPLGNIVDCSYDAAVTETISIPNAQAGEFYIILITNYSNQAGFIKLIQTNFDVPGAGDTLCCGVDLGEDIVACADSVTLNALEGVIDLNNVPVVFEWYFNNVLIAGETQSTITVTQSGTYTVKGNCGLNPVEDSIEVTLSPAINVTSPLPYEICDTAPFDGFEGFDLNILTPQVLGTLVATDYNVSYYILEADAIADANTAIDLTTLFINTIAYNQTIYIRVESNAVSTCFSVVPVDLIVGGSSSTKFEYSSDFFCKNELPNPLPIYIGGGAVGAFTFTPAGLVINPTTGEIDLATSVAGSYTITNTMVNAGPCGDAVYSVIVVIDEPANADFSYAQAEYCLDNVTTVPPIFTGTATAGTFTSTPAGLVLDAVTGVITLQGSTEGTYVVTNTIDAVNACTADDNSFTITLIKAAAATIGYDDPFCASNSTAEPVTLTGTTGGTFSSTTGLTIDANTGTINPSASSPGAYVVTYTTPNVTICGSFSTTANVTIGKELEIDFTQGCNNNAYQLVAVPFNGSFDISTSSFLWTGP
ncbi:fibronectin type III domain-containing protein, partial [Flavobacterium antarcticum]